MISLNQITQSQKKIIIITVIVLLAFIIFWSLIYSPSRKKVAALKLELANIEKEVSDIEKIALEAGSLEKGITLLKERFSALEGKFPVKEEEALSKISDLARQSNISIISFKPGAKQAVLQGKKEALAIGQRICQSILVAIEINCTYTELVQYIERLRSELLALVTVERIEIIKDSSAKDRKLKVSLDFKIYLLS
ncbi:MAG: hypothetical protein K9L86_05145 [Candidatus Omnitrophica bacterium]|nr:hypothetical protein [Candidatus Omnitrophota bacterium]